MKSQSPKNAAIIVVVIVAAIAVLYAKQSPPSGGSAVAAKEAAVGASQPVTESTTALPRLLDLGATQCVPCKMMQPELAELEKEYEGRLKVEFIDVWENPSAGNKYGVQSIPTQIFYDADGKEVFRHVGYYSKDDILAAFQDNGVTIEAKS